MPDGTQSNEPAKDQPDKSQVEISRPDKSRPDKPKADKRTDKGVDWKSILSLWLATLTISGLISLYVLGLAWLNLKNVDADPLDRAARTAAFQLSEINVASPEFGALALKDGWLEESNPRECRSFNTLQVLLKVSLSLADKYHLEELGQEAACDLKTLKTLRAELARALADAVKPEGAIFQSTKKQLSARQRSRQKLKNLSMTLGTLKPVATPPVVSPATKSLDQFNFKPLGENSLPNALLIEADYETVNSGKKQPLKRSICVSIGGKSERSRTGSGGLCLAVSFPHGNPGFESLDALLKRKSWMSAGEWQECAGGTIPGGGRMAPTVNPVRKASLPGDALSISLYHFLRALKSPIAYSRLEAMLKARWQPPRAHPPAQTNKSDGEEPFSELNEDQSENLASSSLYLELADNDAKVNSCLILGTDARKFAFLYKGGAREAGQKAVSDCFQGKPAHFPSSALPLVVDDRGNVNLPAREDLSGKAFDRSLVVSLMTSIYNTNLAASDTAATASLVEANAQSALKQGREHLYMDNVDLSSLKERRNQASSEAEIKSLNEEIRERENRLVYGQEREKTLTNTIARAQLARANALSAATRSFECGAHLFNLAAKGVHRLDGEDAFLLGKRFVFKPLVSGLSEDDLIEVKAKESPWLAKKVSVFGTVRSFYNRPETQIMVEGKSLSDLRAQSPFTSPAKPYTVVFSSLTLDEKPNLPPLIYSDYPFNNLSLPEHQTLYYCQDAMVSGKSNQVVWSSLMRDFVAKREESKMLTSNGLNSGWCKQADNLPGNTFDDSECPTLAGEWQLRAPLMPVDAEMQKVLKGATLTDPKTGQRAQQVPPAGVELM